MGRKLTVLMLDGTATGPETVEIGICIGEAEELATRLKQHIAERDFEAVVRSHGSPRTA